jgi:hypothetical protein
MFPLIVLCLGNRAGFLILEVGRRRTVSTPHSQLAVSCQQIFSADPDPRAEKSRFEPFLTGLAANAAAGI